MTGARIFIHPQMCRRYPFGDIVRMFALRGYSLSNTPKRNIEAKPSRPPLVCDQIFEWLESANKCTR